MSRAVLTTEDPIVPYRQAFIQAAKSGDVDRLVSFAADDIVCMSPNDTTVYGKDEYRSWWEEYFQYFRLVAFTESERHVSINGDFATEYSGYMIAVVPHAGGRMRDPMTGHKEETMKTLLGSNSRKTEHAKIANGVVLEAELPGHEEVARLAYELYERCGCPQGRDLEFWLEAEKQLMNHG